MTYIIVQANLQRKLGISSCDPIKHNIIMGETSGSNISLHWHAPNLEDIILLHAPESEPTQRISVEVH